MNALNIYMLRKILLYIAFIAKEDEDEHKNS